MKVIPEKMRLPALQLRVGLHSGPVISGVVDKHKLAFDVYCGALMEANGAPGASMFRRLSPGTSKRSSSSSCADRSSPSMTGCTKRSPSIVLKAEYSRDPEGRTPNPSFAAECNRLLTGFFRLAAAAPVS
jgi:adenylate cyclase